MRLSKGLQSGLVITTLVVMILMILVGCVFTLTVRATIVCGAWSNCYDCAAGDECVWVRESDAPNGVDYGHCVEERDFMRNNHTWQAANPNYHVNKDQCYDCANYSTVESCHQHSPLCAFCQQNETADAQCIRVYDDGTDFHQQCPIQKVYESKASNVVAVFGSTLGWFLSIITFVFIIWSKQKRQSPMNTVMAGFALAQWWICTGTIIRYFIVGTPKIAPYSYFHYNAVFALVAAGVVNLASLLYTYIAMWLCIVWGGNHKWRLLPRRIIMFVQFCTVIAFAITISITSDSTRTDTRNLTIMVPSVFLTLTVQVVSGCVFVGLVAKRIISQSVSYKGGAFVMLMQRSVYLVAIFAIELGALILTVDNKLLFGEVSRSGTLIVQLGVNFLPVLAMLWFLFIERFHVWIWKRHTTSDQDPSVFDEEPLNIQLNNLASQGGHINSVGPAGSMRSFRNVQVPHAGGGYGAVGGNDAPPFPSFKTQDPDAESSDGGALRPAQQEMLPSGGHLNSDEIYSRHE